jgi:peroxiredoxin
VGKNKNQKQPKTEFFSKLLEDQNGKKVKLADFKGRKLLLYFYSKADTPG